MAWFTQDTGTVAGQDQRSSLYDSIKAEEGLSLTAYPDKLSRNQSRAIGYGFNLDKPGAQQEMEEALGIDQSRFEALRSGKDSLSKDEAEILFDYSVARAERDAAVIAPTFGTMPQEAQHVLTDMVLNMGAGKVKEFENMLGSLANQDYAGAVEHLLDSDYARTLKNRAGRNADRLRGLVPPRSAAEGAAPTEVQGILAQGREFYDNLVGKTSDAMSYVGEISPTGVKERNTAGMESQIAGGLSMVTDSELPLREKAAQEGRSAADQLGIAFIEDPMAAVAYTAGEILNNILGEDNQKAMREQAEQFRYSAKQRQEENPAENLVAEGLGQVAPSLSAMVTGMLARRVGLSPTASSNLALTSFAPVAGQIWEEGREMGLSSGDNFERTLAHMLFEVSTEKLPLDVALNVAKDVNGMIRRGVLSGATEIAEEEINMLAAKTYETMKGREKMWGSFEEFQADFNDTFLTSLGSVGTISALGTVSAGMDSRSDKKAETDSADDAGTKEKESKEEAADTPVQEEPASEAVQSSEETRIDLRLQEQEGIRPDEVQPEPKQETVVRPQEVTEEVEQDVEPQEGTGTPEVDEVTEAASEAATDTEDPDDFSALPKEELKAKAEATIKKNRKKGTQSGVVVDMSAEEFVEIASQGRPEARKQMLEEAAEGTISQQGPVLTPEEFAQELMDKDGKTEAEAIMITDALQAAGEPLRFTQTSELNREQFAAAYDDPDSIVTITIDPETGRVIGHDGGHRMGALAGVDGKTKVPVRINFKTENAAGTKRRPKQHAVADPVTITRLGKDYQVIPKRDGTFKIERNRQSIPVRTSAMENPQYDRQLEQMENEATESRRARQEAKRLRTEQVKEELRQANAELEQEGQAPVEVVEPTQEMTVEEEAADLLAILEQIEADEAAGVRRLDEAGEAGKELDLDNYSSEAISLAMDMREEARALGIQQEREADLLIDETMPDGRVSRGALLSLEGAAEATLAEGKGRDRAAAVDLISDDVSNTRRLTQEEVDAEDARLEREFNKRNRGKKQRTRSSSDSEPRPVVQDREMDKDVSRGAREANKVNKAKEQEAEQDANAAQSKLPQRNAKAKKPNRFHVWIDRWLYGTAGKKVLARDKSKGRGDPFIEQRPLQAEVARRESKKVVVHTEEATARIEIARLMRKYTAPTRKWFWQKGDTPVVDPETVNAFFEGDDTAGLKLPDDLRQVVSDYRELRTQLENDLLTQGMLKVYQDGNRRPVSQDQLALEYAEWDPSILTESFKDFLTARGYTINNPDAHLDGEDLVSYSRREYEIHNVKKGPNAHTKYVKYLRKNKPEVYESFKEWLNTPEGRKYANMDIVDPDQAIVILAERAMQGNNKFFGHEDTTRQDLRNLMYRKDLPKVVRDFYGEIRDPSVRIARTISGQRRLLQQADFLKTVMPLLLESNLANRGGAVGDIDVPLDTQHVNSPGHPLEGIWVTKDVYRALKDPNASVMSLRQDTTDPRLMPAWAQSPVAHMVVKGLRAIAVPGGIGKAGLILGNPGSYFKNYVSAPLIALAGGARIRDISAGWQDAKLILKHTMMLYGVKPDAVFTEEQEARIRELQEANVVDDSVLAEDALSPLHELIQYQMRKTGLDWDTSFDALLSSVETMKTAAAKAGIQLKGVFSMADTWGRAAVYRSEKAMLEAERNAGNNELYGSDLRLEAGIRARQMYPTYSELPAIVKMFGMTPFSSFVAFNVAMGMVLKNNIKNSLFDMGNGSSARQLKGLKRLSMTTALTYGFAEVVPGLIQAALDSMGDDDEEYEPMPDSLRADWDKGDTFVGIVSGGVKYHFNLSDYNPFEILSFPIRHGEEGIEEYQDTGDWGRLQEAARDSVRNYAEPLFGTVSPGSRIYQGTLKAFEAMASSFMGEEVEAEKASEEAIEHLKQVVPGGIRIPVKAANGSYTPEEVIGSLLGMKPRIEDPERSGFFAMQDHLVELSSIRREMNTVLYDEQATEIEIQNAMRTYIRESREYQEENLLPFVRDMQNYGYEPELVQQILRSGPMRSNREFVNGPLAQSVTKELAKGRPSIRPPGFRALKARLGEPYTRYLERQWARARFEEQ